MEFLRFTPRGGGSPVAPDEIVIRRPASRLATAGFILAAGLICSPVFASGQDRNAADPTADPAQIKAAIQKSAATIPVGMYRALLDANDPDHAVTKQIFEGACRDHFPNAIDECIRDTYAAARFAVYGL